MDALKVKPGQRAVVSMAGEPHQQYRGAVATCGRYLRPKLQRNLKPGERVDIQVREVVIDLDGAGDLLIGLPVEVFIEPSG